MNYRRRCSSGTVWHEMTDTLFEPAGNGQIRTAIAPGAIHISSWLSREQQRWIVEQFRIWTAGPVPIRAARLPNGGQMSVEMVCLGWHWKPYAYTRTADDTGGARVLDFPEWMTRLGRQALVDAYQDADAGRGYSPDTALVNTYDDEAKMGMHQDKDEKVGAPVVSLSIGNSCTFRFGNTANRAKPYRDVRLESGDLFVFGGPSRYAFHGVPKVFPDTAPADCGLPRGRLNITMRETGLS